MSLCWIAGLATVSHAAEDAKSAPVKEWKRIAFIGHSFTDGNTWPYLVRQALTDAGRPEPILINAAAGGDVAADNLGRLDWAVLTFEPDLAIIMACAHNVKKMTEEEYRTAMEEMIRKLQAKGVTVLLLYGSTRCPGGMEPTDMKDAAKVKEIVARETEAMAAEAKKPDAERKGEVQIQRDLGRKYGCLTGDMKPPLVKSFEQGNWLWEPDRGHLSFEGYRAVARAALDALGCERIAVPQKLKLRPLPGLVTPWKLRAIRAGEAALDDKTVLEVKPNSAWKTLELPEREPQDSWWPDQVRQEGYAMSLETLLGKAGRYVGVATYRADKAGTAWLNTGGNLQAVWFNGKRIFKAGEWNGYHAGTKRIAVGVMAGENRIVIETGSQFALNITPGPLW